MKNKIKTVLISGGAGFIGSHLIERLVEERYNVIVLELSTANTWRLKGFLNKVKIFPVDKKPLPKVFKDQKIDCVIHLATKYIKNHKDISEVEQMISTNVKMPTQLLELCKEHNVKNFISAGTFFEYKIKKKPLDEGTEISPYNFYAATKVAFSNIAKYYAQNHNINVLDIKIFSPFGDKDNPKLMHFLINSLLQEKEIDFSGGEQKWCFTYVKDIAEAFVQGVKNLKDKSNIYEVLNVGYNEAHSIKEVVKTLEKVSNKKLKINWGKKPYIQNEIFYVNCNNSKIKRVLNWRPKFNFYSGITATYNYYLNGGK